MAVCGIAKDKIQGVVGVEDVNFYVDVSGSTQGKEIYWALVEGKYKEYKDLIKRLFVWGSELKQISKEAFEANYLSKQFGYMPATKPEDIAMNLVSTKFGTAQGEIIIILTDGDVPQESVKKTTDIVNQLYSDKMPLDKMPLYKVICCIGDTGRANESVAAPFTRLAKTSLTVISDNRDIRSYLVTEETRKMLYNLDGLTLEIFKNKFEEIERALVTTLMGVGGNKEIADGLIRAKARLAKELAAISKSDDLDAILIKSLEQKQFDASLQVFKEELNDPYFKDDIGMEISRKFDYLINIASAGLLGQFDMDTIKSRRVQAAPLVKKEAVPVAPEGVAIPKGLGECPILFDEFTAQIMVKEGSPILKGLDKAIVDDIINQPLRILNYPEVVKQLISRLSNWVSISSGLKVGDQNPLTRETIDVVIPLGKCQQNVNCANWALAKLFFGDKLVGNSQMYFAVIWYLIYTGKIPWLSDIAEQVGDTLVYRLKTTKTRASLSGLPQFVGTLIRSDLSLWFIVAAGLMNQPTDCDTARSQIFNIEPLLAMIKLLDYPTSPQMFNQITRIRVMMTMLSMSKRNDDEFRSKIDALYRNCYSVNIANIGQDINEPAIPYIPLDGVAKPEQVEQVLAQFPEYFKELSVNELVWIASKVNWQYSASDIKLPYVKIEDVPAVPAVKCEWQYPADCERVVVEISPKTMRPYYLPKVYKEAGILGTWKKQFYSKFKLPCDKRIFSGDTKYMNFYQKYRRWPNQDEFILYCYNRYCIGNGIGSLPSLMVVWSQDINASYDQIRVIIESEKLTVDNVIERFNSSCKISDRTEKEVD